MAPPMPMADLLTQHRDWMSLKNRRRDVDVEIVDWTEGVALDWPAGTYTYVSPTLGREMSRPRWIFVSHFFNHQTHHRGQVHCMFVMRPTELACDIPN
jgi:uncharacterized damage-inducible protein DinB